MNDYKPLANSNFLHDTQTILLILKSFWFYCKVITIKNSRERVQYIVF